MVESADRGVVGIRMKALMIIANIRWWLDSVSIAKRGKKI